MARPRLKDGNPTRAMESELSEVEKSIADAIRKLQELEIREPSVALCDAFPLLQRAQDLVAIHVEGEEYPRRSRPGAMNPTEVIDPAILNKMQQQR